MNRISVSVIMREGEAPEIKREMRIKREGRIFSARCSGIGIFPNEMISQKNSHATCRNVAIAQQPSYNREQ